MLTASYCKWQRRSVAWKITKANNIAARREIANSFTESRCRPCWRFLSFFSGIARRRDTTSNAYGFTGHADVMPFQRRRRKLLQNIAHVREINILWRSATCQLLCSVSDGIGLIGLSLCTETAQRYVCCYWRWFERLLVRRKLKPRY